MTRPTTGTKKTPIAAVECVSRIVDQPFTTDDAHDKTAVVTKISGARMTTIARTTAGTLNTASAIHASGTTSANCGRSTSANLHATAIVRTHATPTATRQAARRTFQNSAAVGR